jgi:hypothetical protein
MKNIGVVLIVLGLVVITLGFFNFGGVRFGLRIVPILGAFIVVGGFLLYRRNRGNQLSGRS